MFAQFLITALMTWGVAELGCRTFLGMNPVSAFRELFSRAADPEPEGSEDLVQLLTKRREELRLARIRLQLSAKATGGHQAKDAKSLGLAYQRHASPKTGCRITGLLDD